MILNRTVKQVLISFQFSSHVIWGEGFAAILVYMITLINVYGAILLTLATQAGKTEPWHLPAFILVATLSNLIGAMKVLLWCSKLDAKGRQEFNEQMDAVIRLRG